jgi:hypothetical protein
MNDPREPVKPPHPWLGSIEMTNLLHLVVSIVDDHATRDALRSDPDAVVDGVEDLTGEDVAAVADVARVQVEPARAELLAVALDPRPRVGETPYAAAIRMLVQLCDAADAAER